jgi:hypothetical protein
MIDPFVTGSENNRAEWTILRDSTSSDRQDFGGCAPKIWLHKLLTCNSNQN